MKKYPKAFAERNKAAIAVLGLLAMFVVFGLTFYAQSLPIIGSGAVQTAQFAEAGGLKPGNEVRVAGVKVGKVTDVSLSGTIVLVKFRIKGVELGDQTTASVAVKTMLGQKFLAIDPQGSGKLAGAITVAHTTTPYDVNAALSDLTTTVEDINTRQLEKSFEVLSDTFRDTPKSVQIMVKGLTDLSKTVSSRDKELASLFKSTRGVTGTLKDRNAEFAKIIIDGDSLLTELQHRRDTVKAMLTGTARLGTQLQGLVKDNQDQLKPALDKLDQVSASLQRNQDNLNKALKQLGPYYRVLAAATGNGRWVDSYICGLFDSKNAPQLENNVERNCQPAKGGGK